MYRYKLSSPVFNCSHILVKNHITRRYNTVRNFSTMTENLVSTLTNILGIEIEENFWRTKKHLIRNDMYIQSDHFKSVPKITVNFYNHYNPAHSYLTKDLIYASLLRVRFAAVKIIDFSALFCLDQLFFNQNFCIFFTNYSFHNGLNVYLIIFF